MARKQLGTAPTTSSDAATKSYVDGVTGVDAVDITSLATILGSQLANDDILLVIDVSANAAKIITKSELASVLSGVPDVLNVASQSSDPSAPSSGFLKFYAKKIAERGLLRIKGPSGIETFLQPHLGRNSICAALPNGNSATLTYLRMALSATGTATASNVGTSNIHQQMKRVDYLVTTAASTAVAGFRSTAAQFWFGNTAGAGGFHYICRWGPATGTSTASHRAFVGMRNSTGAPTDVNPSTLTNMIGMGWDTADTNIQFMYNDASGTASKIDLGASFVKPSVDNTSVYELAMFVVPNTTVVYYEITNLTSGAVVTGSVNTDIPSNTTLLTPFGYHSVGGTSSVVGIALMGLYIETDY